MARYPYDVNTTRRYIDVNKQFNGGLKTIDTDDSLGAVFLRQAENVSLSEFGFIEKRYGTYEKDKIFDTGTYIGELQGFWEYTEEDGTINEIAVVGGKLFLREAGQTSFTEITKFKKEGAFEYNNSIIASSETITNFIPEFTHTSGSYYRADTGELVSTTTTTFARTNKLHITEIEGFNPLNKLLLTGAYYIADYSAVSYIAFWDDSNNYMGYFGSPQLNAYTPSGLSTEITLTDNKLGLIPLGGQEFTIPEGAQYVAFVLDNSTYTDPVTNTTKYVWGQTATINFTGSNLFAFDNTGLLDTVGGKRHTLTSDYYPFQSTKEIQAAFVKDTMYIFNGSYPIYYKGGSTFYLFPIYRPSSTELTNAGHNFLESRNFDQVYGYRATDYELSVNNNRVDKSLDFEDLDENEGPDGFLITPRVSFVKKEFYPKFPFAVANQKKGELTFELNYNYGKELSKTFDPYAYGSDTQSETVFESATKTNTNYVMRLHELSFAAVNSANPNEYVKIDPEKIDTTENITNFTSDLNASNGEYNQFRVRDTDGLFRTAVTETQLNAHPSPTHIQADPTNPVLNIDETKRNFLGGEVKHPHGISQLFQLPYGAGLDLAISIEDEIVRTKDSGNLAGQKFAIRFKRETAEGGGSAPTYDKLDWSKLISDTDSYNENSYYQEFKDTLSPQAIANFDYTEFKSNLIDTYLSRRLAVIIRPILNNITLENKEHWKVLHNNNNCRVVDGILEFIMPEFDDKIENEIVTGYAVDIKTVDKNYLNTPQSLENYKENYNGRAHRAILVRGGRVTSGPRLGLRNVWTGLVAGRSQLDYNLIGFEGTERSGNAFGSKFKATVTELIPGNYDFKLTFAVEENQVPIQQPYERDNYQGTWSGSTIYDLGDYVKYGSLFYKSLEANNHNHQPDTATTKWEEVTFADEIDDVFITNTTTQFINVYFRNIEIFGEKITDYTKAREDGKSPILSCTKVIEHYGKLLVYGSEELPESVFVSFPDNYSYYPHLFRLEFFTPGRDEVQSVTPFMDVLVAQTDTMTWGIRGTSPLVDAPNPYATFMITPAYGTIAPKSVQVVRNKLFFLSHLGVVSLHSLYAVDQQYNVKHEDTIINNIVPHDTKAVGVQFDNQYWLNFPNYGITLRWYANKNSWVQDKFGGYIDSNGTHQTSSHAWDQMNGVFKWQIVGGYLEFITYKSRLSTSGNTAVYRVGIDYTLPHDMREPISSLFETSFLNQNYPFHPKNYKEAKLDFSLQNEYNKGRLPFYDSTVNGTCSIATHTTQAACEAAGGTWDNGLNIGGGGNSSGLSVTIPNNIPFLKNHKYRVEFVDDEETVTHIPLTSVSIEGNATYATTPTPVGDASNTMIYEFFITNDYVQDGQTIDFSISQSSLVLTFLNSVTLRDVTYDDQLTFDTYIISEDQTLNFDNYSGYTQATVDVGVDLTEKERLGDWKFGTSDFGKKVTAVKTIKLSGKGYNSKLYLEDTSSSKWTLESLGITYKMRRARSK